MLGSVVVQSHAAVQSLSSQDAGQQDQPHKDCCSPTMTTETYPITMKGKRKERADANERRNAPSNTCPEAPNYAIPKILGGCASALPPIIGKCILLQIQQISSLDFIRIRFILQILIRTSMQNWRQAAVFLVYQFLPSSST